MMKQLIFLVSFRRSDEMYPPFGLMYVADALEKAGFRTEIFHITEEGNSELIKRIEEQRPLFVGFNTVTGPTLLPTIKLSRQIHKLGIPVVWGGVHATIMPLDILKNDYVDFIVVNEGEATAAHLAILLSKGHKKLVQSLPGLACKDESGRPTFSQERPFMSDLDRFRPLWEKIDIEKYLIPSGQYSRAIPLPVSRGCPFKCGFCYNPIVQKRTWRRHSDEFVVDQIEWLKKNHHVEAIDFTDDYLFGQANSIMSLIEKLRMPWSGQIHIQLLTPEFARWMQQSNCQWVNIGVESGAQRILDELNKNLKVSEIREGIKNLVTHAPDVEVNLSFITALPGETLEERSATLDLIQELAAKSPKIRASLNFYMPFPGTPLWSRAIEEGFKPPVNQEDWGDFDIVQANLPWINTRETKVIRDINSILFVGKSEGHWILKPYYRMLQWRWQSRFFKLYWEGALKRAILNSPFRSLFQKLTKRLVKHQAITHKGPLEEI
jgi:anaerobic magnesium-protoporphyrin IX monomethyl ester cyclase